MSRLFSVLARTGAYLITFLLAAVWIVGALDTLMHPLFDIGRRNVGDVIVWLSGVAGLSPKLTFQLAHLLGGLKLLVGTFLLTTLVGALYDKLRYGNTDDATLDVALFIAASASAFGALPGVMHGGEPLQAVIGELMLCVIASWLAIYSRGYVVQRDVPAPVRPALAYPPVG